MQGIDLNWISQFGTAGLFFILMLLWLKWHTKNQSQILQDAKEERATAFEIMRGFQKAIDANNETAKIASEHLDIAEDAIKDAAKQHADIFHISNETCRNLIDFRKSMSEAHDARQKEHERIMQATADMHSKRQSEHEKTIKILEEMLLSLARINGYKHE